MWLLLESISSHFGSFEMGNIQVPLDVRGVDLGCQAERIHQELSKRRRRLGLLVQHVVDVVRDALEHIQDLMHSAL